MKIYLAHSITGLTMEDVIKYYEEARDTLEIMGYEVYHPMTAKGDIQDMGKLSAMGAQTITATPHAIARRDIWMVRNSDVLFLDLSNTKQISIGCLSELAIAYSLNKHTVVVMEKGNIHEHCFVKEEADIVFEKYNDAISYLRKLIQGEI